MPALALVKRPIFCVVACVWCKRKRRDFDDIVESLDPMVEGSATRMEWKKDVLRWIGYALSTPNFPYCSKWLSKAIASLIRNLSIRAKLLASQ